MSNEPYDEELAPSKSPNDPISLLQSQFGKSYSHRL